MSHQGLGEKARVGCHFLLQEIFLTPGIKPVSLESLALTDAPLYHLGSPGEKAREKERSSSCY